MKMKKTTMWKQLPAIASALALLLALAACGAKQSASEPSASGLKVMHEEEFGGVYIDLTIDAFNDLGFVYGDGVTITFSNGYTLENIPYYSGYYTRAGEPLLVTYPGYPYIEACVDKGDSLWVLAGLSEGDRAEITLSERGAYLDIQNARNIRYEDDRALYASDAVFANFRSVKAGTIQENMLYRSASPCDNQHNRAPYVDALMAAAGVDYILDLADNEEKILGYLGAPDFESPYFLTLYEAGKVVPVALNVNYGSKEFREKLAAGLTALSEYPGPYLVHCTEGKDRTGFVCMLLEALCGASFDEIVADYMITYDNYYGITKQSDPEKYDIIVRDVLFPMLSSVVGDDKVDLASADLAVYAERFLTDAGMSSEQIGRLKERLQ
ncbi:MAG: tyrosine-protein phosphatase [Oscillospiraceae bacterium]|nr:tyrosine-protein phosphatase [Oscillospiraceae bacterium]